jgi:hypothetical protein
MQRPPNDGQAPVASDRASEYREYFASRRPSKFGERVHRAWNRSMFALVSRFLPGLSASALLEVGPGLGFFGRVCLERGVRYSALEMNAAQADALRTSGLDAQACAVPPFPPGPAVQVIWMSHVLEHAATVRDAFGMVSGAFERLDPGGHLVVIAPDVLSWRGEFWSCDWTHGFPTSLRRVRQLLGEAGFEIAEARHHACFVDGALAELVAPLARLIPYRLLDAVFERVAGRSFAYAFMVLFGWRQILVIGRKP